MKSQKRLRCSRKIAVRSCVRDDSNFFSSHNERKKSRETSTEKHERQVTNKFAVELKKNNNPRDKKEQRRETESNGKIITRAITRDERT